MITTTYKCDRCKKTSTLPTDLNLETVTVGVRRERYGPYNSGFDVISSRELQADWCGECRHSVGIYERPTGPKPTDTRPTLEELITEIVEDVVAQSKGN